MTYFWLYNYDIQTCADLVDNNRNEWYMGCTYYYYSTTFFSTEWHYNCATLARSRFELGMFVRSEFYYPSAVPMPWTIYGIIVHSTIRLCKVVMRCRQWKSGNISLFYDNMSLTRSRTMHYIILAHNRCRNGWELCAGKHTIISTQRWILNIFIVLL